MHTLQSAQDGQNFHRKQNSFEPEGRTGQYEQYVNPALGDLLDRLRMNKRFVGGEGSVLVDQCGNRILDAISGYGSVPFGHNPDWLWQCVRNFEESREPIMVQPSDLAGAGELAEALLRCAPPGLRHVTFGNSGTEAVEAAIKACRMATGRLGIISTENGFHGKTLGALSATGRDVFQEGSGAPVAGFHRVPFGDADALEAVLRERAAHTAAFIVEPIQGEGGVVEAPPGYLRAVRSICDRHNVLLVVDEVQTGLGRTGALFACEHEGITPDALTLAKALGGGLVPVSACLLGPKAYSKAFALKHSSTFGGNALAMRVGLRVVERLTSDRQGLLENVVRQGAYLKQGLQAVQRDFGSVILDVRGRGLMLAVAVGVDRETIERESGALFTLLGKGLAPFAASYLLNVTRVRVAPTLHAGNVLRVQPPLTVTRDECDWIIEGFASLASVIAEGRSDEFVRHLLRSPDSTKTADAPKAAPAIQPKPPARRSGAYPVARAGGVERDSADEGHFGFIVHFLDGKSISEYDKSLAGIDPADLEDLASRFEDSVEPFVASTVTIESEAGRAAKGTFIALPRTTRQLLRMSSDEALDNVGAAIRLAKSRGARIVGLGGYTSVIVQNFKPLLKLGVALTTGNSYTVVSAIDAAMEAARITSRPLAAARTAVVGGAGSIGSALASLLAERVPSLVLVGRDGDPAGARSRFATIVARMMRHAKRRSLEGVSHAPGSLAEALSEPACAAELAASDRHLVLDAESERRVLDAVRGLPVRWTTDLPATIGQSDLVFLATSSPDELVTSAMVRPGTVICDLSRPANVGDELHVRSDVLVIDGGIVEIPGRTDLGFHFGLAPGHAYACMAETMMLSLERMYEHTSMGRDLSESTLGLLKTLAGKHGFRLADLRARQRPLDFGGLGRPLPAHTSRAHLLAG